LIFCCWHNCFYMFWICQVAKNFYSWWVSKFKRLSTEIIWKAKFKGLKFIKYWPKSFFFILQNCQMIGWSLFLKRKVRAPWETVPGNTRRGWP